MRVVCEDWRQSQVSGASATTQRDLFNAAMTEITKIMDDNLVHSFWSRQLFLDSCKRQEEETGIYVVCRLLLVASAKVRFLKCCRWCAAASTRSPKYHHSLLNTRIKPCTRKWKTGLYYLNALSLMFGTPFIGRTGGNRGSYNNLGGYEALGNSISEHRNLGAQRSSVWMFDKL